jgi:hypothetical protein
MSKTQEYRKKAEEAEASAKTAHDLGARQMCLEIAEQYRFLAQSEEATEGRTPETTETSRQQSARSRPNKRVPQ